MSQIESAATPDLEMVAVIGMAGRFPGARTPLELWRNLCAGIESITFFTDEELIEAGNDPEIVKAPNYVKAGGILGDTDQLEASFFGLSPRDAALMDPQHRLFLQCAWEALENAGYSPDHQPGRIGVFGGSSMNTYMLTNIYKHIAHVASVESLQASIGNDKDSLTTEVAYRMNLTGPAVTVQSSSSTSLVVIHYACQSLLSYECDVALAGGATIHFPEKAGYLYYEGGTTSPDGHCRTFDARAKGFVAGNGAGVVTLKRLSDALRDHDTIYAVVRGSAVNNDGSNKVSYMAPSVEGQVEVVALAQAVAGVEPDSIGYVETHGTATPMGDPIEVTALTQAFRQGTDAVGFCALGSIKTNIGHLDAAAGVTGFIKATLCLHHKQLPPHLHFERPNPAIDFARSPFFVNTQLRDWLEGPTPRRAGVTSLGMGGTNAHAILEEAPPAPPAASPAREAQLLLLSARTATARDTMSHRLSQWLLDQPDLPLADVAYTLQAGRKRFAFRRAVVTPSREDAALALSPEASGLALDGVVETAARPIMFLFPGQGAQVPDMGREIYQQEAVFKEEVDACAQILLPYLGFDLRTLIFPPAAEKALAADRLKQTALAQPALFVVEYALARLWQSWGLEPEALLGHSLGEYVAACLAGVFSRDDALRLVAARGRLMQALPPGSMLAVSWSADQVAPYLVDTHLSVAAVNSPQTCVISGETSAMEALTTRLEALGASCTRLNTSHAFHSPMMDPILEAFEAEVRRTPRQPPRLPFLSNLTGTWITDQEALSPSYWSRHLRQAVRFAEGVAQLMQTPSAVLLEVGPGQTLAGLARQHPARGPQHVILGSMPHHRQAQGDGLHLLGALARLWLVGVEADWKAFQGDAPRHRVPLPTYPFERSRHWIDPPAEEKAASRPQPSTKSDVSQWVSLPCWKPTPPLAVEPWPSDASPAAAAGCWWLLLPPPGEDSLADQLGAQLKTQLEQAGIPVLALFPGNHLEESAQGWTLPPGDGTALSQLLSVSASRGLIPAHIVHGWLGTEPSESKEEANEAAFHSVLQRGFFSLTSLATAWSEHTSEPVHVTVLTRGVMSLDGLGLSAPRASILGATRVIPQEYPHIRVRLVDIGRPAAGRALSRLADRILQEARQPAMPSSEVLLRGSGRWTRAFEALEPHSSPRPVGKKGGTYLLLGGLGTLGLAHAEALASGGPVNLVLVSRSGLPPESDWHEWQQTHGAQDITSRRIQRVRALREGGSTVQIIRADVSDPDSLKATVAQVEATLGPIRGIVFAAGTVDRSLFRAIPETSPTSLAALLQARVHGLVNLRRALEDRPVEFILVCSSLAATLGGLGLAGYAATMNVVDAWVACAAEKAEGLWTAVGWDAWHMDELQAPGTKTNRPTASRTILPEEGRQVCARLLQLPHGTHVLVSTQDLTSRLSNWTQVEDSTPAPPREESAGVQPTAQAPRPTLGTPFVPPRTELEAGLALLWREALGLEQVGMNDNFFDLGGNSLLGVKLIQRVRDRFGVALPAVSLYEGPTVEALARLLEAERLAPSPDTTDDADPTLERKRLRRRPRGEDASE